MNFLRKVFRIEPPSLTVVTHHDPEEQELIERQERQTEAKRQELRTKLQKVKTESGMLKMAGGALRLMEADRDRR